MQKFNMSEQVANEVYEKYKGDTIKVVENNIYEIIEKGKELGLFAERFIKYLRDVLMVKITNKPEIFLNTSAENVKKIEDLVYEDTIQAYILLGDYVEIELLSSDNIKIYIYFF